MDKLSETSMKQTFSSFEKIRSNAGKVADRSMAKVGAELYWFVYREIKKLGHYTKTGHNTMRPLIKKLHRKKYKKNGIPTEKVFMETRGRGVNPSWVEFGTKAHGNHPGADARLFFRIGIAKYKSSGKFEEAINKISDTLFPKKTWTRS